MEQALLVVDIQPSFNPPEWQVEGVSHLARTMRSVATVERHDETITPFWKQLGWKPAPDDQSLVVTDRVFVKHGYSPPPELIRYLKDAGVERVLVCGIQADTCCLAAGFMLFDAGLHPTMLKWLTVGSSLDRSAGLGARLWRHHFGQGSVLETQQELEAIMQG
ncbi:nicotinamidase-related amidase [Novosphingobium sp. PhB165]|uniref:cysteine hydrolase family protein n=1 Tax=Novosphingobium sp. PhB165 TaxID=2485105 RepID=UPI001053181E|nr:cysteine hydrolase family protein [Novosphingobium sp. PhB165]TCM12739.1 nicotinamidase-related amidase [Novosphingobium sp. PhB165]